jgi:hypothetical protein
MRDFPNTPGEYTWEDWKEEMQKKHPVKFFLNDTLPLWFRVRWMWFENIWYWIRCHTYTKYHLIDIRSKEFGYKWGWMDRDSVILLANFTILKDFVEKEHPFDVCVWDENDEHARVGAEIKDLYDWWMNRRAKEHELRTEKLHRWYEHRGTPDGPTLHEELNRYEEELDQKDENNLIRLMKIRKYLWT